MQAYTITKILLDGTDITQRGLIAQMRPYRTGMKMKSKDMVERNRKTFGSSSHLSGLEHNRQSETTEQIIAYAKSLGVKELTIKL